MAPREAHKALGYILLFVIGLLTAALCALATTDATYGDIGPAVAFVILIGAPVAVLLCLWVAFKLVPKKAFHDRWRS